MRISKHGIGKAKKRRTFKKIDKLHARNEAGKLSPSGIEHLGRVMTWLNAHLNRALNNAR